MGDYEEDFVLPAGYSTSYLLLVIIFVILFNLGLFIWCKRRREKLSEGEMQTQVQIQVEKYFRLQGNEIWSLAERIAWPSSDWVW